MHFKGKADFERIDQFAISATTSLNEVDAIAILMQTLSAANHFKIAMHR